MVDGMAMLMEREKCEKNVYFIEWISRIQQSMFNSRETVANGRTLSDADVRFYQGQKAAFDRVLLIPDEILEDCKPRKETEE